MKLYNTNKDKYGNTVGAYEYLCDRDGSCSGTKFGIWFEICVWNFISRIVNTIIKTIK